MMRLIIKRFSFGLFLVFAMHCAVLLLSWMLVWVLFYLDFALPRVGFFNIFKAIKNAVPIIVKIVGIAQLIYLTPVLMLLEVREERIVIRGVIFGAVVTAFVNII